MPQTQQRQQPGVNDMQMLQRNIMLKQLQELRRHQQLQELGDGRQQIYLNQISSNNKQASMGQFSPQINGTPIHDASQMFLVGNTGLVQRGASNGFYSQAQSQQLEASLYGTPIASAGNNLNQYSHLQRLPHDSANVLTNISGSQTEKPTRQSGDFGNSCLSSDQHCMPDGAFVSKQFFHGKDLFGQVPDQGFSSGGLLENFQPVNPVQMNTSAQQFNGRQEQAGWPEQFPGKTTQIDPSQGLSTLDPLEQKILFNMDDNSGNASFVRNTDIGTGGFGNRLEHADYSSSFPSIQSGSWSALMQSAVAEASSSDTGLQEEWSGLSFQNTDQSTDNQASNFVESGRQQTGWIDNNAQGASTQSCKPQLLFNDSDMNSSFPEFQQSGIQFSIKQREGMHYDSSHESVQQNRPNQPIEGSRSIHTIQPFENAWPGESFEHSVGNAQHQNKPSYNSHQFGNKLIRSKMESPSPSGISPKSVGDVSNSTEDLEKGRLLDIQRNKASEEVPPRGIGANVSASFKSSVGIHFPNQTSQTSHGRQNILELLHKVDHANDQRTVTHLSSTDSSPLLEVSEAENPDPSIAYDQSFISQRFGLRLAPPSQRLPNSSSFFSLQSSPQSGNSTTSPQGPPYLRNQLQWPHMPAALATQSPQATSPGTTTKLPWFNHATSQGTSQPTSINPFGQQFPILEATPVSQLSLTSGLSQPVGSSAGPPSLWTNVPTHPHQSVTEPRELPSDLPFSVDSTDSKLQTPYQATQELYDQNSYRGTVSRELGACSMSSQGSDCGEEHPGSRSQQRIPSEMFDQALHRGLIHGQEAVTMHLSEANMVDSSPFMSRPHQQNFDSQQHGGRQAPAVTAKDLEAFGRSLKRSNPHLEYSLLHQVRYLKKAETDPSRRDSDKNLGPGSDLNVQQVSALAGQQMMYGRNSGARDLVNNGLNAASPLNSFPSRDVKTLNFSSKVGDDQSVKASPRRLQETPQMASHDQSYSQNDPTHVSLQMAPSWFKQYGTLKNGQIFSLYDASTAKNSVPQFPIGNPFENVKMNTSAARVNAAGPSQVSGVWPTAATTSAAGKLSPPYVLPSDVIDNLSVTRSKKRKFAMFEFLPWHKEVTQGSKRLLTISMAELEWAQAANRLVEQVEDEAKKIEDVPPLLRSKKRLVLTTQLMQQVFRPAPAAILSADVLSNYDSVAYFAAKLALGDVCNLTSCSRSDSYLSFNSYNTMSEKSKTPERIGEQYFSKIVEDFTSRAKKLESDLFRLDKEASIVDLRVEYKELEKFSLINRFAKFHSRGQPDAGETSSSSGTTPTKLKSFPQRYVTGFPMPRTVPEGAQCISL